MAKDSMALNDIRFHSYQAAGTTLTGTQNGYFLKTVGGYYNAATITYNDQDAVPFHFTSEGLLKCSLADTTITLNSGDIAVDVTAFRGISNQDLQAWIIDDGQSLSGTTVQWLGIGGYHRAGTTFRAIQVDQNGSVITATGTTGGVFAEDTAHTSGDKGQFILAVRNDALADMTSTDGDYSPVSVDSKGAMFANITLSGTTPQAYMNIATGTTPYTTAGTTTSVRTHMHVSLGGSNDAIVSLDNGTTEHYRIPANSAHVFDGVYIQNSTAIRAKNATLNSAFTNLNITVW